MTVARGVARCGRPPHAGRIHIPQSRIRGESTKPSWLRTPNGGRCCFSSVLLVASRGRGSLALQHGLTLDASSQLQKSDDDDDDDDDDDGSWNGGHPAPSEGTDTDDDVGGATRRDKADDEPRARTRQSPRLAELEANGAAVTTRPRNDTTTHQSGSE